ncbi:MAG: carboxypeptidase-like regulatory domain-containing protein, partial [Nannocystaceae bacterium]
AGGGSSSKPKVLVDPVFIERTTERDEHGVAKVITGLDVKVSSGEALWRSGQALGYASDGDSLVTLDQIHWEIFSEHLLVTDWEAPIDDPDDDIVADVPKRLVERIEEASPELERDGLLLVSEIRELYASGRGEPLRRTPCRFISHWALDPDTSAAVLGEMGYDTEGLAERLRPLMWWDQAIDVLPKDRHVWHYNPIELLGQYAGYLESMKPIEPGDPATEPTLVVWVYYVDGRPIPDAKVQLLYGIAVRRTATTRADGSAWFHAVPVGDYGVRVDDPATAPREVSVMPMASPDEHNQVEIHTDVEGPPRKRGTIKVQVRKHTGTIAGSGIEVWLEHDQAGPVTADYTEHGKVRFENIVHGSYTLSTDGAEPVQVTLDRKERNAPTLKLRPPIVTLWMRCTIDGEPGAHQLMSIVSKKDGTEAASGLTDADGEARFEVPQGHYRAHVGEHDRSVSAQPEQDSPLTLRINSTEGPVPEAAEGILAVTVTHDDAPAVSALVFVSDAAQGVYDDDYPNADGVALFELPPGRYEVRAEDETRHVEVRAWDTTAISMALHG